MASLDLLNAKDQTHAVSSLTKDHRVVILTISHDPLQHFCPSCQLISPIFYEQKSQQINYLLI